MHQRSSKEVQRTHRLERETEEHTSVMVSPASSEPEASLGIQAPAW